MPQCVVCLLRRGLRDAIRVEGNSARGRREALGPRESKGRAPHFKRITGLKKHTVAQ